MQAEGAQDENGQLTENELFAISSLQAVNIPSKLWCHFNCGNDSIVVFATMLVQ